MLALIPMILSLHQALEGFVWLAGAQGFGRCTGYSFASIAFGRFTFPWRLGRPKPARTGGGSCLPFLALGALIAAAAASVLYSGLTIDFAAHHIRYLPGRRYPLIFDYLYAIAVSGPLLLYRDKYVKIFGCLIGVLCCFNADLQPGALFGLVFFCGRQISCFVFLYYLPA